MNDVYDVLNRIDKHLIAAVVSNDQQFVNEVLGNTVNGCTHHGIMGRTAGAYPTWIHFGSGNDPRAAGASSHEGIIYTWSCHREIVKDVGPVPEDWSTPPPS